MKVLYYKTQSGRNPLEAFLKGLSKPDKAKFEDIFLGIQEDGLDYQGAELRQLEGKLWEIKFRAKNGHYRIAYVLVQSAVMVWLHAFRKDSQKTPRADLDLAHRRMKEVLTWQP